MPKPPLRPVKAPLVIFCEGEVTEPGWLAGLGRSVGNRALDIRPGPGAPLTLVGKAATEVRRLRAEGETEGEVWCVFDVDEHPRLPEARLVARQAGVHLAVSNPCFELWLLLHFREQPGMQHRRDVSRMLREFLPRYEKSVEFAQTSSHLRDATKRARRLAEDASAVGEPGRNPSTDVYLLVERIMGPGA